MRSTQLQWTDNNLHVYKWEPDEGEQAYGVMQIVHGSCEHANRYERFAHFLTERGWIVYASDLRGHGRSVSRKEDLGYFGERDGWNGMVEDLHQVTELIREEHPAMSIFLFGHSMGSFLARHYAIRFGSELAGLILSGTAHHDRISLQAGRLLANREIRRKGIKHRSMLLYKLTYAPFNKRFEPARSVQDWLSRDQAEVDLFLQDELCGFIFTAGGFRDMFDGLLFITDPAKIRLTPSHLPVYFISGQDDPVGRYGKMVQRAYDAYRKAGLSNIEMKLYDGMRHEILNEIGREEVYEDILRWMAKIRLVKPGA
ncbi:alpha/beta hydrolase [Paenibacillus sp. J2TS4]|uniref:alpha/beta hydrolase n=1 Tax=Paenibacillus sp. J2TS4 TaxID=2807194 RepID=UPI001B1AFBD3|nr:alpha/beta hydrolase [Paenibacillus sp. J2TS4]GIP32508.1 alpha/beta hydrolase [Paenibacillus sp. J2TS4]